MKHKNKRAAKGEASLPRHAATSPSPKQALRQRADEMARANAAESPENIDTLAPEAIRQTLHELRVHQIELELQNEELRRAQAELDTSKARYFDFYDLAPVGYCSVGEAGLIVEANLTAAALLGVVRAALVGQPISRFIFKQDQDIYYLLRKQLLDTGGPGACELRLVKPDGTAFWASLDAIAARAADSAPHLRIVLSDISSRKRTGEALRVSEERLAAIIDTAMDAIITLDESQHVVLFNAAAEKLFDCRASEAIGKPLDRFLPERFRENHRHRVETFATAGIAVRSISSPATIYGQRANGEEFPCEATISKASTGGRQLYTVILRDISERKHAEQLADFYAKSKLVDQLKTKVLANVHHELRTPLTLILGPIQKALAAGGLTQAARQDLEMVERNARLLQRHVNDLLDLSKLDAGKTDAEYADTDLARLARIVAAYFELSALEHGVGYTLDIPGSLPAQVDPRQIERVLVNLLSNAFKFTPAGGSVRLALRRSGDRAIVEVEDTGPGIPVELRETVFERFWQGEGSFSHQFSRGTGLGLSIVKEFVSLHRGRVTVAAPSSGIGSLFTVELPLSAPGYSEVRHTAHEPTLEAARQAVEDLEIRTPVRPSPDTAHATGTAAVLVIEDNPDMNAFIAGTLAAKFRVFSAFDAHEGLEKALSLHPDLILTDIRMPGTSGDQLVREIRKHAQLDEVPIVLQSVVTDAKLKVELLQAGAQDFLHKPFRPEELLAKVERFIADRGRAAAGLRDMHRLSANLLEGRDRERKQVANELNENVAQYLASLGMYLSSARDLNPAPSVEVQRFLDEGRILLRRYSLEIQTMAGGLYPEVLDDFGLAAAIRSHVGSLAERHGIEVSLDIAFDLGRLSAEHEMVLYRVMEEALKNVCSHSGSTTATVRVVKGALEVSLEVIDAGRGMSIPERPASGSGARGTGIQEMRERVRNLGGRLELASAAEGTTITAVLPLVSR